MIAFDRADADLGTGQVLQDGDRPVELPFKPADHADDASMKRVVTVAEIKAGNIHAGLDKLFENVFRSAGGSDGADNFSPSHFHQST